MRWQVGLIARPIKNAIGIMRELEGDRMGREGREGRREGVGRGDVVRKIR